MRWKQFFTPVKSFSAPEAKTFMDRMAAGEFTLLDVRQPEEYEISHIPGAFLIPLPDLGARVEEIDAGKPVIVYCAIGGRSRIGAQMLAGKGFTEVYNLSGGIKAWGSGKAVGSEVSGLELFSGAESPEETLAVAYSLEEGLRDFYLSMAPKVGNPDARGLFEKLAAIEVKHQEHILEAYTELTGEVMDDKTFVDKRVTPAVEGGLTTTEYLRLYGMDMDNPHEIISLAMAIEAQALDLYHRAAAKAESEAGRDTLNRIADEERAHLASLGRLFERFPPSRPSV